MSRTKISIPVPDELAEQLPADPEEQQQVLILGLQEWRINKALQAYKRGEGSLAYAARQAGDLSPRDDPPGVCPRTDSKERSRVRDYSRVQFSERARILALLLHDSKTEIGVFNII